MCYNTQEPTRFRPVKFGLVSHHWLINQHIYIFSVGCAIPLSTYVSYVQTVYPKIYCIVFPIPVFLKLVYPKNDLYTTAPFYTFTSNFFRNTHAHTQTHTHCQCDSQIKRPLCLSCNRGSFSPGSRFIGLVQLFVCNPLHT